MCGFLTQHGWTPKKNENFPVKGAELQVKGPKKDLLFALRDVQYMQYYMYYLNIYKYI